ncbi:MAG: phage tail protein [Halomonadaceae bacterium]|nr:phage tail protein [Halomonadaceae bacterium]
MDTLPDIPADFGPSLRTQFKVDQTEFGDGYVQRQPAGLNSVRDTWSPSWTLLTQAEYEQLDGFLRARKGVTPFLWQPPWEDTPRQWICQELSSQRPTSARFASISATFVEDFSPS